MSHGTNLLIPSLLFPFPPLPPASRSCPPPPAPGLNVNTKKKNEINTGMGSFFSFRTLAFLRQITVQQPEPYHKMKRQKKREKKRKRSTNDTTISTESNDKTQTQHAYYNRAHGDFTRRRETKKQEQTYEGDTGAFSHTAYTREVAPSQSVSRPRRYAATVETRCRSKIPRSVSSGTQHLLKTKARFFMEHTRNLKYAEFTNGNNAVPGSRGAGEYASLVNRTTQHPCLPIRCCWPRTTVSQTRSAPLPTPTPKIQGLAAKENKDDKIPEFIQATRNRSHDPNRIETLSMNHH